MADDQNYNHWNPPLMGKETFQRPSYEQAEPNAMPPTCNNDDNASFYYSHPIHMIFLIASSMWDVLTQTSFWVCVLVIMVAYHGYNYFQRSKQRGQRTHEVIRGPGYYQKYSPPTTQEEVYRGGSSRPIAFELPRNSYVVFQERHNGMSLETIDLRPLVQKPHQTTQGTSCYLDKFDRFDTDSPVYHSVMQDQVIGSIPSSNQNTHQSHSFRDHQNCRDLHQPLENQDTLYQPTLTRTSPVQKYCRFADASSQPPMTTPQTIHSNNIGTTKQYHSFLSSAPVEQHPKPHWLSSRTRCEPLKSNVPVRKPFESTRFDPFKRSEAPLLTQNRSQYQPFQQKIDKIYTKTTIKTPKTSPLQLPQHQSSFFHRNNDQRLPNNLNHGKTFSTAQRGRPGFSFDRNNDQNSANKCSLNFGNSSPSPTAEFVRRRSTFYGVDQ